MNINFDKRHTIIGFSLLCCICLFGVTGQESNVIFANSELATSELEENIDRLFIGIPRGTTAREAETILQDANLGELTLEKIWPEFGMALVKIPEPSDGAIMAASRDAMSHLETYRQALAQIPDVDDIGYYNTMISIPEMSRNNWDDHLSAIDQLSSPAPSTITNTQEVVVAILTTGFGTDEIDVSSYPLWGNQAEIDGIEGVDDDNNGFIDDFHGWDWIDNDNVMNDELGYGTVTGKVMIDMVELAGLDRNNVKLMPLRILGREGKGQVSDLVDALAYAARKGVRIVSINLITYYDSPPLRVATEIAYDEGLLLIAPSANQCRSRGYWPAAYDNTLGVTYFLDTEIRGMLCPFRYESDLVVVIKPDDTTRTNLLPQSLTAPYTAALASLILFDNPNYSNVDIQTEIFSLADYASDGILSGIPVLDIQQEIQGRAAPTALSGAAEPNEHQFYLPLITK